MKRDQDVRDLNYWQDLWKDGGMDFEACADFWNNRASSFNESVNAKNQATENLVSSLRDKGIVTSESLILDIGCGPGTHAIPMAKKSKEVVAMDISSNMLAHLNEKAFDLGLANIETIKANWVDISLAENKWEKKFDLVFASMSPAIHNYQTLKKMCDASRGYCYVSAWAKRVNKIEDALFEIINKKENQTGILEDKIYYVFNILWNMGYYPEVTYTERKWSGLQDFEEAFENYKRKLMIKNKLDDQDIKKIREKLKTFKDKDKVVEESEAVVGTIIWRV